MWVTGQAVIVEGVCVLEVTLIARNLVYCDDVTETMLMHGQIVSLEAVCVVPG